MCGYLELLPDGTCDGEGNEPPFAIVTFKYDGYDDNVEVDIERIIPVSAEQALGHTMKPLWSEVTTDV